MILNVLYRTQVKKSSYFNTSDKKAFNFRQKYNVNFIDFFAVSSCLIFIRKFVFKTTKQVTKQRQSTSSKRRSRKIGVKGRNDHFLNYSLLNKITLSDQLRCTDTTAVDSYQPRCCCWK